MPPGRRIVALAALAGAVVAAFANSFRTEFVLDARPLILENPALREASLANVFLAVSRDYWQPLGTDGLYRPLATLSYLFNYAVLGNAGRPFGYHAVNLLLHLACAGLVYALVRALVARETPALLAAALFGLHPVTTEAVTNVVGRADVLATLGVLAGLGSHARLASSQGGWRTGWLVAVFVAAVVAFFGKESGLTLLPLIGLYELVVRRGPRSLRPEHAVVLAVAAVYLLVRWMVARAGLPPDEIAPIDNPIVEAGFWSGRLTGIGVIGRELVLLLWPRTLSADYSFAQVPVVRLPPHGWDDWQAVVALGALLVLVGAALRLRRTAPALAFFLLFPLVALLPTGNVLVVIGSIMADRFLYLPLAGFAATLALLAERVMERAPSRRAVVGALAVLVLLAYGARTVARNRDWRDEVALWQSTVRTSPQSAKAHKGFAAALFTADPAHRELERVVAEAERAVAIRPDYVLGLIDLGGYYIVRGDAVAAAGGDASAWYARSTEVLERGRALDREANRRFAARMVASGRAGRGIPEIGNVELYQNLALACVRLGRFAEALEAYEVARRLTPMDPSRYVDVSAVLLHLGRWEDAAVTLFQAVTIRPGDADAGGRLVEVYRTFDPHGGEVGAASNGRVTIDLGHPVVRRHRCAALAGLASIYAQANQPGAAAGARELHRRSCAADGA